MEIKLWNGNHEKHVSFKITNSKAKLATLHFNNMKDFEARHEVLEDAHMLENFKVVNTTQNVKEYLRYLKVNDMRLSIAVE